MAERDDLQARIAAAARPLTDRQRAFVLEYLRDLNGTQAAIRAGYAGDRAASTASRRAPRHTASTVRASGRRIAHSTPRVSSYPVS